MRTILFIIFVIALAAGGYSLIQDVKTVMTKHHDAIATMRM